MGLTLLIGGAASGKSALAVRLGKSWKGQVAFIATAQPLDEEMQEKIGRHRSVRPPQWKTIEEPVDLESAISSAPADAFVIIDCLTLWLSNLMENGLADDEIDSRSYKAASSWAARAAPTIVVTNEVGSGIVPANALARRYRDLLGRMNSTWATVADMSLLLVAGRAVALQRPETLLDFINE
jgi:adenosylcobinamide kinase/adenosylcobinamide-phosphate guanylyltransferase